VTGGKIGSNGLSASTRAQEANIYISGTVTDVHFNGVDLRPAFGSLSDSNYGISIAGVSDASVFADHCDLSSFSPLHGQAAVYVPPNPATTALWLTNSYGYNDAGIVISSTAPVAGNLECAATAAELPGGVNYYGASQVFYSHTTQIDIVIAYENGPTVTLTDAPQTGIITLLSPYDEISFAGMPARGFQWVGK
jgi:hypothetical protein